MQRNACVRAILPAIAVCGIALAACSQDPGPMGPEQIPESHLTLSASSATISGTTGAIVDAGASSPTFILRYVGNPAPGGYSHSYQWAEPRIVTPSPEDGPITMSGTLDIDGQVQGQVSMIGLIDLTALEAGVTGFQTGAYIYVFRRTATEWRIGVTDGNAGGEIVQTFIIVPATDLPADGVLNVVFTVDGTQDGTTCAVSTSTAPAGCMTLQISGGLVNSTLTDSYGDLKHADSATPEFANGAVPGWDDFVAAGVIYDLTVTPTLVLDGEGPTTTNTTADPNPVQYGTPLTLTADVDDAATGGSTIASAEYTLDGGATWTAMAAADGTFDEVAEAVTASFNAPATAGIYDLCVRGTDGAGNIGAEDCTMLVVYDPAGGFVTGGGWIESPAGAFMPSSNVIVSPEDLGVTWVEHNDGVAGTWDVSFASGPATPPLGSGSARFLVDDTGRAVLATPLHAGTRFDAIEALSYWTYRESPTGGVLAVSLQFDVDYDLTDGSRLFQGRLVFEPYQSGATVTDDTWQEWDALAGEWWATGGAGAAACPQSDPCTWSEVLVAFPDAGIRTSDAGANSFGMLSFKAGGPWEDFVGYIDAFTIDLVGEPATTYDFEASEPFAPSGKAHFGFVSKYKKGASTPDGNTEFVFQNAGLDFHSTSYDWLVINQGGSNAQFKGWGTVNGTGSYRFMLWAGDGTGPDGEDTFRIKIWQETGGGETVVYDNGMDQPIAGGSIKVHKK